MNNKTDYENTSNGFNRTIEELKYGCKHYQKHHGGGFNRTIEELKLPKRYKRPTNAQALIVPLRN